MIIVCFLDYLFYFCKTYKIYTEMNRLMKLNLCFATIITLVMFVACAKDEITSLTLNYTSLNFSIGQTDSLVAISWQR